MTILRNWHIDTSMYRPVSSIPRPAVSPLGRAKENITNWTLSSNGAPPSVSRPIVCWLARRRLTVLNTRAGLATRVHGAHGRKMPPRMRRSEQEAFFAAHARVLGHGSCNVCFLATSAAAGARSFKVKVASLSVRHKSCSCRFPGLLWETVTTVCKDTDLTIHTYLYCMRTNEKSNLLELGSPWLLSSLLTKIQYAYSTWLMMIR